MKKILLGVLFFAYMQISLAQLRVDANSQLHIGGTSPTERLDVNGAIRIGTTSNTNAGTIRYLSNVFEGYNGTDWIDLTGNYNALDSVSILFSGFGKTHIATENIQLGAFYLSGDGGNEGVFIDGSGNVGIGENAPSAKLDINGEVLINGIDIGKGDNELSDNTVFGVLAGTAITSGNYNTFIGKNTGIANTTGEKNTFFGRQAGYSNITGSDNVFIGHQAGYNETGSDKLYIDNSSTSTPLIGGDFSTNTLTITGDIEYTGTLTDVSDSRLKKDIEPLKNSLEKILKINPVSFKMKADGKGRTQLGVIAQNVKEHFPQVVSIIDPVNGFLGVDYTQLVAPLIGAMKAQQAQIEQLQKDIKKLKKRK